MVVLEQVPHGRERVARPGDHVQQHRVRDAEVAGQRLGLGVLQLLEAGVRPADEALGRLLAHDPAALLHVVARPGEQPRVLHLVVGRLGDDRADGVVAGAARAAGDLVELAGLERAGARAVVLGQRGEQHGADRHVDADAEGVGAADDLAAARPARGSRPAAGSGGACPAWCTPMPWRTSRDSVLPNPAVNRNAADQVGDRLLVLLRGDVDAHQRLRPLHGRGLREVHDVDRRLVGGEQLGDRLVQRGEHVAVVQRHRPLDRRDHRGVAAGAAGRGRRGRS